MFVEGPRRSRHKNVAPTMTHRTQQRGSLMLLILLAMPSLLFQNAAATNSRMIRPFRRREGAKKIWNDPTRRRRRRRLEEEETVDCRPTGKCEMCTNEERSLDGNECEKTGRHIQHRCTTTKGGGFFIVGARHLILSFL